ncbi:MAG TPA: hypothetical protein VGX48_16020 [Pyrinomonadaceae bacterium]|nr:hypothetical protein [Pyrinomonadaceae bacterium]
MKRPPVVVQGVNLNSGRKPTAPPVYRPNPTPKVLQLKKAVIQPHRASVPRHPPAAPQPPRPPQPRPNPDAPRAFAPRPQAAPCRPAPPAAIQRAIVIGSHHLPRKLDEKRLAKDFSGYQIKDIVRANAKRDRIYFFDDKQHFVDYFKTGHPKPFIEKVSDEDLERGHKTASLMRFGTIYEPSPNQIPGHAPGGHNIPEKQLPPSGFGHHWAQTRSGKKDEFTLWQNKFEQPDLSTEIHTFGNPNDPTMLTSYGEYNMGGRVNPTPQSKYLDPLKRSETTYGGLDTETLRVRGHMFALRQNQKSTDPKSDETLDNCTLSYTNESDGTKGGFSTFRYNQIENPAIKNKLPFNQVNENKHMKYRDKGKSKAKDRKKLQKATGMGIPMTHTIYISQQQPGGKCDELKFDNEKDYRTEVNRGKGYSKRLHTHVTKKNSFPYEPVHKKTRTFEPEEREHYKGYQSPPPTPLLTRDYLDVDDTVILKGRRHVNEAEFYNGDLWFISKATYDPVKDETTCKLIKPSSDTFNF